MFSARVNISAIVQVHSAFAQCVHLCAGVAVVSAHGGSEGKDAMLALFEGYLERKVLEEMDEEAYDRVREGAVIFLGTLARHLEPSGPKV